MKDANTVVIDGNVCKCRTDYLFFDQGNCMRVTDKYVFFWGGEFSQWYMIPILWNDVIYNCAEQAMMASKAKLFKDDAALENIMCAEHPKQQKPQKKST